jgi:hypothetical protein
MGGRSYGGMTQYIAVDQSATVLTVYPSSSNDVVASFAVDLSGPEGEARVLLASGFLDPSANNGGEAFGLLLVSPDGTSNLLPAAPAPSLTARVQIIHNAADPAAALVDIYLGDDLALDDFAFRSATPYLDLPAGVEVAIGVAPSTSTSAADAIAVFPVTLADGETYSVIANGVLDPGSFAANPDGRATAFGLWIRQESREEAQDTGAVEFFVVHGATDAPGVDVVARDVATLVPDAKYGDITDYIAVSPSAYTLDIKAAGTETVVASFAADLSGLTGGAGSVLASGFLDASANGGGAAFGLLLVLPDGSTSLLPAAGPASPTARVQIIHNAADPAAALVDIYLGDDLALDDFAFRSTTPYLDLPAGVEVSIGVAPSTSTSAADAIATFPVTLTEDDTYTVIATGVLDPGSFAVNPDGRSTAFELLVRPEGREAASNPESVEFLIVHGATDAPAVDIVARGVATLATNARYGDITDYIAVPAGDYVIDIKAAGTETVVASFAADLNGMDGKTATVVASGFLDPAANEAGSSFGLVFVNTDGTMTQPAIVTSNDPSFPESSFELLGNYPNPFVDATSVGVRMPSAGTATLSVYDIRGSLVSRVEDVALGAGLGQAIPVNLRDVASGTYLYEVEVRAGAGTFRDTATFVVLR